MSEGSVYQRSDGRWCAQYKALDGKQKYKYRKTKKLAKQALREALTLRDEGKAPAKKMTVADLFDEVLDEMRDRVSLRTYVNRESFVRVHLKPAIGSHQLAKLNHRDVHGFYRNLSSTLSPSTIKKIHILLTQATRIALRRKYIAYDPMAEVNTPTVPRKEMRIFTPDQVKHLLHTARGDRYELAYVLGATLALRVGEVLAARWDSVDLDKGTITIRETLWKGQTWSAKSQRSRRTLEIPQVAHQALQRSMDSGRNGEWLIPTSNNTPVAVENFWRYGWKPALKKAGLNSSFTFHKLRHSAASFLLLTYPLPVVSRYLGHAGSDVTARLYSHIVYGSESVAGGIDQVLG